MRLLVLALAILALPGCAALDTLTGTGRVSQSVSTFDHARIVEVTPNLLYDPKRLLWAPTFSMGARWSSATPDSATLVIEYVASTKASRQTGVPAYLDITGLGINLGGDIQSFPAVRYSRVKSSGYNASAEDSMLFSRNAVAIPYTLLAQMVAAKDCRLRVYTNQGYEDFILSVPDAPGSRNTAVVSLRKFVAQVRAQIASPARVRVTSKPEKGLENSNTQGH